MFEGGKCNPIFLFIFLNVESLSSFSAGGKKHESLLVPRKKGKTPRRARGEESSSPVSEEIKVKNGAHWKTCLLKSTLTDRVPVHNLHRPSSLYICLPVSFRHQKRKRRRERKKRESPAVRSFFFFYPLHWYHADPSPFQKIPRFPSIKSSC